MLNLIAGPSETCAAMIFGNMVVAMVVVTIQRDSHSDDPSDVDEQFCEDIAKMVVDPRIRDRVARVFELIADRLDEEVDTKPVVV